MNSVQLQFQKITGTVGTKFFELSSLTSLLIFLSPGEESQDNPGEKAKEGDDKREDPKDDNQSPLTPPTTTGSQSADHPKAERPKKEEGESGESSSPAEQIASAEPDTTVPESSTSSSPSSSNVNKAEGDSSRGGSISRLLSRKDVVPSGEKLVAKNCAKRVKCGHI